MPLQTSEQTVMSGLVGPEIQKNSIFFVTFDDVRSHPFTGFLWSICGPFTVGAGSAADGKARELEGT